MGWRINVSFELLPPEPVTSTIEEIKEPPFLQVDWTNSSTVISGILKDDDYFQIEQLYNQLNRRYKSGISIYAGDVLAQIFHRLYPICGNLADTLIWLLEKGPCGHWPFRSSIVISNFYRFLIRIHWRPSRQFNQVKKTNPTSLKDSVSFSIKNNHPYLFCALTLTPENISKLGLPAKLNQENSLSSSIQIRRFGCRKTISPKKSISKESTGSMFKSLKNVFNKKGFRKKSKNKLDLNPVFILKISDSDEEGDDKTQSSDSEDTNTQTDPEESSFFHSKSLNYQRNIEPPNKVLMVDSSKHEKHSKMYEELEEPEFTKYELKNSENLYKDFEKESFLNINQNEHKPIIEEEHNINDLLSDQPENYSKNIDNFMSFVDDLHTNFLTDDRLVADTSVFPETDRFAVKSSFIEDMLSSNPLLKKKPHYLPHSSLKNEEIALPTKITQTSEITVKPKELNLPSIHDFDSIVSPLLLFNQPLNNLVKKEKIDNNFSKVPHPIRKCKKENVFVINVNAKSEEKLEEKKDENSNTSLTVPSQDESSSYISPLSLFKSPLGTNETLIKESLAIKKQKSEHQALSVNQYLQSESSNTNSTPTSLSSRTHSFPIGDIGKEQIGTNVLIHMVHRAAEKNLLDKRTAFDLAVEAMAGTQVGVLEKITTKPKIISTENFKPPPQKFPFPPLFPHVNYLPKQDKQVEKSENDNFTDVLNQLSVLNNKCKKLLNGTEEISESVTSNTFTSEETLRITNPTQPLRSFDESTNITTHTEDFSSTSIESEIDTTTQIWTRYQNNNLFRLENYSSNINPYMKIKHPAENYNMKPDNRFINKKKIYSLINEPKWMHNLASSRSAFYLSLDKSDPALLLSRMPLSETRFDCDRELKYFRKRLDHFLVGPQGLEDSPLIMPRDRIPVEAKQSQLAFNMPPIDGDELIKELIANENMYLDINQPIKKREARYFCNIIDEERICFLESKINSSSAYRICTNIERSQNIQKKSNLYRCILKKCDYNKICSLLFAKFIDINVKSKFVKYKNNVCFFKNSLTKVSFIDIFKSIYNKNPSSTFSIPITESSFDDNQNFNEDMINKTNFNVDHNFKLTKHKNYTTNNKKSNLYSVDSELQQFIIEYEQYFPKDDDNKSEEEKEESIVLSPQILTETSIEPSESLKKPFLSKVLKPIQYILDQKEEMKEIYSQEELKNLNQTVDKAVETYQEMKTNITIAVQCRMAESFTESKPSIPKLSNDKSFKEFYDNILASLEKMEHSINQVFCIEKFFTIISQTQSRPRILPIGQNNSKSKQTDIKKLYNDQEKIDSKKFNIVKIDCDKKSCNEHSEIETILPKDNLEPIQNIKLQSTEFDNRKSVQILRSNSIASERDNVLYEKIKRNASSLSNTSLKYSNYKIERDPKDLLSSSVNIMYSKIDEEFKSSSSSACLLTKNSSEERTEEKTEKPEQKDVATERSKVKLTTKTLPELSLSSHYKKIPNYTIQYHHCPKNKTTNDSGSLLNKLINVNYKRVDNNNSVNKPKNNETYIQANLRSNKKSQVIPKLIEEKVELPLSKSSFETENEDQYHKSQDLYMAPSTRLEESPIVIKIKKPPRNEEIEFFPYDKFIRNEKNPFELNCSKFKYKISENYGEKKNNTTKLILNKNDNTIRKNYIANRIQTDEKTNTHQNSKFSTFDKIRYITSIQPSDNPHPSLLFTDNFCYLKPYLGIDNHASNCNNKINYRDSNNSSQEPIFSNLKSSFPIAKQEMNCQIKNLIKDGKRKLPDDEIKKETIWKRYRESHSPSKSPDPNFKTRLTISKSSSRNTNDFMTTCTAMVAGQWNRDFPIKNISSLPSNKERIIISNPMKLLNKLSSGVDDVVNKTVSYINGTDNYYRRK